MEQVIVRMNHHMQMALLGNGPEGGGEMGPVEGVQDLSPHGLLLAALGECTAVLLHSYAARREVGLAEVEVRMWWEECTDCRDEGSGKEQVRLELWLSGALEEADRKRLVSVAKQCPIHRMLHGGVPVLTEIVDSPPSGLEATGHGHGGHDHGGAHGHNHGHGAGDAHGPTHGHGAGHGAGHGGGGGHGDGDGDADGHGHGHGHGGGHGQGQGQGQEQDNGAGQGHDHADGNGHGHGGGHGHGEEHEHGDGHDHGHRHGHGHESEVHAQGDGRAHAPPGEIPPDNQGPSVDDSDGGAVHRHDVVRAVPATDGEDA